jgi:hypothetical protein
LIWSAKQTSTREHHMQMRGRNRVYVSKMRAWAGSFIFDLFLRLY